MFASSRGFDTIFTPTCADSCGESLKCCEVSSWKTLKPMEGPPSTPKVIKSTSELCFNTSIRELLLAEWGETLVSTGALSRFGAVRGHLELGEFKVIYKFELIQPTAVLLVIRTSTTQLFGWAIPLLETNQGSKIISCDLWHRSSLWLLKETWCRRVKICIFNSKSCCGTLTVNMAGKRQKIRFLYWYECKSISKAKRSINVQARPCEHHSLLNAAFIIQCKFKTNVCFWWLRHHGIRLLILKKDSSNDSKASYNSLIQYENNPVETVSQGICKISNIDC